MKMAFKVGIIFALLLIFYFSYYIYFKTYAERVARGKVQQYCEAKGHDFKKLDGPAFSHALGLPEFDYFGCDFHPAVYGWHYVNEDTNKS